MSLFFAKGSPSTELADVDLKEGLTTAFDQLGQRSRVIAVPPDFTRFPSRAGKLTCLTHEYFGNRLVDVMPALGTHSPMSDVQIEKMFPGLPKTLIRAHRWREDVVTLGTLSAEFVRETTGGLYDQPWPAQMNKLIAHGGHDLILSIGQVVPHEVLGMANYNKNVFIGTGGDQGINQSHFISGVCGVEKILGQVDNPLRSILDEAQRQFCQNLPLVFVLTVVDATGPSGTAVRGLYVGDDRECFELAAALAREVNFTMVDEPIERMVAYLDPEEFHSTWLGNKAIYRTRMAIADDGELIVLGPGINTFGEDPEIDRLIRKYGYRTTPETLRLVDEHADLRSMSGVAAHIMHSSPENRFRVTLCPGELSREEVEGTGLKYGELDEFMERYPPTQLREGWNHMSDGQRIYFVRNPALGLWAHASRFAG